MPRRYHQLKCLYEHETFARVWAYELLDNCENDEIMSFSTTVRLNRPARKSIAGFHWDAPPNAT